MKRTSKKRPGFDCIRHPCGRNGCGTRPGASHGVHSEEWIYAVSDGDVGIVLLIFSGVFPSTVPPSPEIDRLMPMAAGMQFHVGFPTDDESEPQECEYVAGGTCYQGPGRYLSYLGSDEFMRAHFDEGAGFDQPESFWLALESQLAEELPSIRAERKP